MIAPHESAQTPSLHLLRHRPLVGAVCAAWLLLPVLATARQFRYDITSDTRSAGSGVVSVTDRILVHANFAAKLGA